MAAATTAEAASGETKTDVWQQILEISSKKDVVPPKNLIVVGDSGCGASSLLAHMQGVEERKSDAAASLQYSYLDVFAGDEEDEPISRINVWQLEGSTDQRDLLRFGINSENVELTAALICVDFTRPWKLVSSIQKWLDAIHSFVESLNLDPKRATDMKQNLVKRFAEYTEPTEDNKPRFKRAPKTDQTPPPTLPEGVFEKNCGIPIIVTCTNSDACETLERDFGYKDSHFEYIHQYLRRICLKYGATLIYTSVKNERTSELLFEYIQHVLYDMDLSSKPQLLERETVFVPAGWDTQAKIQADFDNQRLTKDAEEPYSKVIAVPPALQLARQTDKLSVASAEEDHVFLQRLHQQIQSDPALASSGANPESQQMFLDSLKRMGVVGGSAPSQNVSAPSLVTTPAPAAVAPLVAPVPTQPSSPMLPASATSAAASIVKPTSPSVPSASSASDLLASLSSTIAAAGSPARVGRQASSSVSSTAEHQALHSFFNSLLGGSGPAGASREAAAKVLNNNPK